jgi:hypothetical protein
MVPARLSRGIVSIIYAFGTLTRAALYRAAAFALHACNGSLEWLRAASSPGLANFRGPPPFRRLEDARRFFRS